MVRDMDVQPFVFASQRDRTDSRFAVQPAAQSTDEQRSSTPMFTFNKDHGFAEALVKGLRSGFLTDEEYHHVAQCDNLEGV